jgi:hypothetical protein
MGYYDHKIAITLTVGELTALDEAVTTKIEEARYILRNASPTDIFHEEAEEDLQKYTALQEKIQYHLS